MNKIKKATKVGILYHPKVEATIAEAKKLQKFLEGKGVSVWLCSAWDVEKAKATLRGTDLVLSVGGDGTILRAAQVVSQGKIPITGINLGKLGFLTELSVAEAPVKLPAMLAGKGWTDERAMLDARLAAGKRPARVFHALNEVAVARGAFPRAIMVEAIVDGEHLATYKADGVIVATATGSTGYALAAGGPVIYSQSKDMLLMPLMPHLSLGYPIVLPATVEVKLRIITVYEGTLSVDGHTNLPLSNGDTVSVKLSADTVRFLRIHPQGSFYSSLEQKLKGK